MNLFSLQIHRTLLCDDPDIFRVARIPGNGSVLPRTDGDGCRQITDTRWRGNLVDCRRSAAC